MACGHGPRCPPKRLTFRKNASRRRLKSRPSGRVVPLWPFATARKWWGIGRSTTVATLDERLKALVR